MGAIKHGLEDGLFAQYAKDQHIYVSGKRLIDCSLGCGTHIHGHAQPFIVEPVIEQIRRGSHYGFPSEIVRDYADLLQFITTFNSFVFCSSGSEAVMRAFRIARHVTGKECIAIMQDAWHGSFDGTVWKDHPSGANYLQDHFVVLPQDPDEAVKTLELYRGSIAMVFVEPVQNHKPQLQNDLITKLYHWTRRGRCLFGFDEIITGFRLDSSYLYNVRPDISTYGKIAGGGFPIGIVAFNDFDIDRVFTGGTFSANPVSLLAGYKATQVINNRFRDKLNASADLLRGTAFKNFYLASVGSFMKIVTPFKSRDLKIDIQKSLREEGVHINANMLMFLSDKHTEQDIHHILHSLIRTDKRLYYGM